MNESSLLDEGQEQALCLFLPNPLQSCQVRAHKASPQIRTGPDHVRIIGLPVWIRGVGWEYIFICHSPN